MCFPFNPYYYFSYSKNKKKIDFLIYILDKVNIFSTHVVLYEYYKMPEDIAWEIILLPDKLYKSICGKNSRFAQNFKF